MYKKNSNIIVRRIHGSVFLINIADNYMGDKCALYEINETGEFIWNHINGKRNIEELTKLLQEEIVDEIDYAILFNDISEFIDSLKKKDFLLEVAIDG